VATGSAPTQPRAWVVRLAEGVVDRGIVDVLVSASGLSVRSRDGSGWTCSVPGPEIARIAQEWAGLHGRVLVERSDGTVMRFDLGVLPADGLFAAVVSAAGGPNDVRSD